MLTVSELAKRSGTTSHAVRYYTRIGLLNPRRDPENGYRLYEHREIQGLLFTQRAKRLGYTLSEIKSIICDAAHGKSPCPQVRQILQRRIKENRRQLEELLSLQSRMEKALFEWSGMPDGVPDGHSVCHLIETFAEDDNDYANINRAAATDLA